MSQFQLPARRDLYYGGGWHQAAGGTAATVSPSTGQALGTFAVAAAQDVDRAVVAARAGFAAVAPRRPARARPRAPRDGPPPGRPPRRAGLDRRDRRRQPGTGAAQRRGHRGRAARLLRRPGHRDEGRLGADGAGRGELLGARAARRRGPHHPVQPPVHVLRGQARLGPGGRQRGHRQAARAGPAVRAADRRTSRGPVPARGLLRGHRRRRDRGGAGQPPRGGEGGADRQRERGPGGDAGRGRPHPARPARAGRQERADRLPGRRSRPRSPARPWRA